MLMPENILEKQICSECQKYLSVGPVKVYPNRQVKCGRCSTSDDLGSPSVLFNMLIKNFTFPCINRYDGCNVTLPLSEMAYHENKCHCGHYECFFCPNFAGGGYDLNMHCQMRHKNDILQNKEFWIDFGKGRQDRMYFFVEGARIFLVRYDCDIDYQKLIMDIKFIGNCFKGDIFYSFSLYSTENDLIYTTKRYACTILQVKEGSTISVDLDRVKALKNIAVCRFFIHDEPELAYEENLSVVDDSLDTRVIKCTFKNLNEIEPYQSEIEYPHVFYFKGIAWKMMVTRRFNLVDRSRKFYACLQWFHEVTSTVASCRVTATFSLLSADNKKKICKKYVKQFCPGQNRIITMHDWDYIMNMENGFIKDNCLNIEVKMTIHFPVKKEVKCGKCERNCAYCNDKE